MTRMYLLLVIVALVAGACGTPATPEWAAEVEQTQVALAETAAYETSIAPTATPTNTPSPTPLPPTATPIPPTATPTETPAPPTETFTPSPIPTEAEDNGDADADAGAADTVDGDPEAGRAAFEMMRTEVGFACATCHYVDQPGRLIGPSLQGISEAAATRVEGESAVEYLRNSILHPDDYLVEDETGEYPAGLMPQTYADVLTEQEVNDMIAYLLTL